MKRTWIATIFAAAAMTATAQAEDLKADVPFDFTVAGKKMPAGTYVIAKQGSLSSNTYTVHGTRNKAAAIALSTSTVHNNPNGDMKLVFRCNSSGCAMAEIHRQGTGAFAFATPAPHKGENERTVAVKLTPANAGF